MIWLRKEIAQVILGRPNKGGRKGELRKRIEGGNLCLRRVQEGTCTFTWFLFMVGFCWDFVELGFGFQVKERK